MKSGSFRTLLAFLPILATLGCGSDEVHMSEAEMKQNISDRHKQDAARSLPPGVPEDAKDKILNTKVGSG
ncbi:hypothetical protein EON81_06635 [bacterium]|nr:MAG: hypothetical protein EON81_06635 [bacterium]